MRVSSYLSLPKELKEKQGCGVKHLVDMKDIDKFEQQNNISVNVYWFEDKKVFSLRITTAGIAKNCVNLLYITAGETSHYVCWKTWAKWYQHKIIITTTENVSGNIVHMTKPVKRYWKKKTKSIWKGATYTGHKESNSQNLMTWRSATKSNLQKQNTNYVYFLSSMQISKVFYDSNKIGVGHDH